MTFSAPNPILNATAGEASAFLSLCTSQGKTGGALFVNPVQSVPGENAGGMLPQSGWTAAGVPAVGPLYIAIQFNGSGDYYNVGLCLYFLGFGVPFNQIFQ